MRNKSRKRILHEQRVEIAKLRRLIGSYPRYRPSLSEIVTLRRDFLVPLNLKGGETMLNHETYKSMKELVRQIVPLLEIRCEDVPTLHSEKYTIILRVVRPSSCQIVPDDFMKTADGGSVIDDLPPKPEPWVSWYPADEEIGYGGVRDGGRMFYETHVLGKFKAKDGTD